MAAGELWCIRSGPDEDVASIGCGHHGEVLRRSRANDNYLLDVRVSLKGVRGANRDVTRNEQANPHEGCTGTQSSVGSGGSLLRSRNAAAAMTAATTSMGE